MTGEKLRRPLKYFRDKGNDFELTITYEYYDATVTEGNIRETGNGSDHPTEESKPNDPPAYLGMIVNAGLTRW